MSGMRLGVKLPDYLFVSYRLFTGENYSRVGTNIYFATSYNYITNYIVFSDHGTTGNVLNSTFYALEFPRSGC